MFDLSRRDTLTMPNSVLIIDDSAVIRRAVRLLVGSRPGWTICGEAINGEDGLQKAQQLKPDAIVLDMSMPQLNGMEMAEILKRLMPMVPLIMFTNFAKDQFFKRELSWAGICQVVSKSDSKGLLQALDDVFTLKRVKCSRVVGPATV
jgi:DNA-binding NarL/FixJ family response regulator